MRQFLTPRLAWRYLISKKSHNAVGAISVVAIVGMAIATASMICVLSVFNGFRNSIADRLDRMSPDIIVTPAKGKVFDNADKIAKGIMKSDIVETAIPTITDNALALKGTREMPITLKGADIDAYRKIINLDSVLLNNDESLAGTPESYVSVGAASTLHIYPGDDLILFTPKRHGRVNLANPAASFITDSIYIDHIFQSNQKRFDEDLVITDYNTVAELLQYDTEASAIEISLKAGTNPEDAVKALSSLLGPKFTVKDRARQQEMDFRMVQIEKWITFLLLFFILIIASFNIISSLSMLVLEKKNSLSTLRALGLDMHKIGSIFFWESLFITSIGGISGIIGGVILCLAQQKYGFIKIAGDPGALVIKSYPVALEYTDILFTLIPIAIIGLATAFITSAYARSQCRS